ncbi:DUF5011 domain-containing protein [Vibrio ponticus]|uniref:DUF5011 domain-containing protein n=1 Tax=Vibrio ponticus TaxID=265668 RepID=A0A3N3DUF7_9VIBR|nr:immunoglobulin-like domain-containing protein [Vibrio ponticus]ROV58072.1 DUF5011 domain-containing protein [Vibrio ponticus]
MRITSQKFSMSLIAALILSGCELDVTPPVVTLIGEENVTVEAGTEYLESGATAEDDIDEEVEVIISGDVDTNTLGTYTVTYTATDVAGNSSSVERIVTVNDTLAPDLSLNGAVILEMLAGEEFVEPGWSALDLYEGSVEVEVTGSVDSATPGSYTLNYSATDRSGNQASETRTVTVLPSTILSLTTQNYFNGELIPQANVTVTAFKEDETLVRTGLTDAEGELQVVLFDQAERIVVHADAENFGEYSQIVTNRDQIVNVFLQPVNTTVTFTPTNTNELVVEGLSVVSLNENALVDENGRAPSGDVNAEITIIDPSIDPNLMPGNFETVDPVTGEVGHIESFGAISVTFSDQAQNNYNLADGQTATIRIPLSSGAINPPATIPLYYFDDETGYWVEEGTAELINGPVSRYYQGTVSHFTTWNADIRYQTIQIRGCVVDGNGEFAPFAQVRTQGVNYTGTAWSITDAQGQFSVPARFNSSVLLSVVTGEGLSRTSTIQTSSVDTQLGDCLSLEPAAAVISLTWGQEPRDLDTHFFGPVSEASEQKFSVYYGNKNVTIGQSTFALDVDDTSSFGPEVTTVSSFPHAGRYSYAVYRFSGAGSISDSPARIELNYNGYRRVFSPPAGQATTCWAAFDFVVDEVGGVTIEEIGEWKDRNYCYASGNTGYPEPQELVGEEESFQPMLRGAQLFLAPQTDILKQMIEDKYYAK